MRRFKELYLTSFVFFFRVGSGSWTPDINAWKGVICVTMIEWALMIAANAWVQSLSGAKLIFGMGTWTINTLLVVSLAINYVVLVTRGYPGSDGPGLPDSELAYQQQLRAREPEHAPALEIFLDKENAADWSHFDLELCLPIRRLAR